MMLRRSGHRLLPVLRVLREKVDRVMRHLFFTTIAPERLCSNEETMPDLSGLRFSVTVPPHPCAEPGRDRQDVLQ